VHVPIYEEASGAQNRTNAASVANSASFDQPNLRRQLAGQAKMSTCLREVIDRSRRAQGG